MSLEHERLASMIQSFVGEGRHGVNVSVCYDLKVYKPVIFHLYTHAAIET